MRISKDKNGKMIAGQAARVYGLMRDGERSYDAGRRYDYLVYSRDGAKAVVHTGRLSMAGDHCVAMTVGGCSKVGMLGNRAVVLSTADRDIIHVTGDFADVVCVGDDVRVTVDGDFARVICLGERADVTVRGLDCEVEVGFRGRVRFSREGVVTGGYGTWVTFDRTDFDEGRVVPMGEESIRIDNTKYTPGEPWYIARSGIIYRRVRP